MEKEALQAFQKDTTSYLEQPSKPKQPQFFACSALEERISTFLLTDMPGSFVRPEQHATVSPEKHTDLFSLLFGTNFVGVST